MAENMAENISVIKAHLEKAVELESFLYTYGKIREEMKERLGLVSREAYEVKAYEYGQTIPYESSDICQPVSAPPRFSTPSASEIFGSTVTTDFFGNMKFTPVKADPDPGYKLSPNEGSLKSGGGASPNSGLFASVLIGVAFILVVSYALGLVYGVINVLKIGFNTSLLMGVMKRTGWRIFKKIWFVGAVGGILLKPMSGGAAKGANTVDSGAVEAYRKKLEERNGKLAEEHRVIQYCNDTLAAIPPMEEAVTAKLKKHYSAGLIYPKYQNFVAVAQIYEYLDSGRCDSLVGANGAYNLFEQEMRANTIIVQLDQIYSKLEEIRQLQISIYQAVLSTYTVLQGIEGEIANLSAAVYDNTTAINNFNAQVRSCLN